MKKKKFKIGAINYVYEVDFAFIIIRLGERKYFSRKLCPHSLSLSSLAFNCTPSHNRILSVLFNKKLLLFILNKVPTFEIGMYIKLMFTSLLKI